MKIFSVTATWDDGDHEMSSVVSTHATKESADEALATAERSPEAESDLVRYAVEELELASQPIAAEAPAPRPLPTYDEDFYRELAIVLNNAEHRGRRFDFIPYSGIFSASVVDDETGAILERRTFKLVEVDEMAHLKELGRD